MIWVGERCMRGWVSESVDGGHDGDVQPFGVVQRQIGVHL